MSLERSLSWRWTGVRIPKTTDNPDYVESHEFSCLDNDWWLQCYEDKGVYVLFLCRFESSSPPPKALPVHVRVRGGEGAGPDCEPLALYNQYSERPTLDCMIWKRRVCDVERSIPGFTRKRKLTFIIELGKGFPLTDESCTSTRDAVVETSTRNAVVQTSTRNAVVQTSTRDAAVQTSIISNRSDCLESLSQDLAKMLSMGSTRDVELHCGDLGIIKAHRDVLSSRSRLLSKVLQSDTVEGRTGFVSFDNLDTDTFQRFLRYIYCGRLDEELDFDAAMSLYEAGAYYEVLGLRTLCSDFLRANLSVDNACNVLAVADEHNHSSLAEVATEYILKNKIPMSNDHWSSFSDAHPKLASRVLLRSYKMSS